jgi:hypothetical protein
MKVTAIMATCGRHTLCERSLRFFLDQDYRMEHDLIIYNNSEVSQRFELEGVDEWDCTIDGKMDHVSYFKGNKKVHLINNHIDSKTGKPYATLGAIYNDILKHISDDTDIVTHWDDDDIFLPNHIGEGIEGLHRANMGVDMFWKAYKPEKSYYRHPHGIELMGNNLEPSVFVEFAYLKEYGYYDNTENQHMKWFQPLLEQQRMYIDRSGAPTLIYNWGDTDIPTFKTSGNAGHINNFQNYRNFSQDHGDLVITPWTKQQVQKYYDLVNAKTTV